MAVVALFGVALVVQVRAADPWNKVDATHFTVVGEPSHGYLRSVATTLEQFRAATTSLFPERTPTSTRPLTVVVVSQATIRSLTDSVIVGGFYTRAADHDYIVMPFDASREQGLQVALHEYQHVITHATWPRLPKWIDEGLAEFYSTFLEVDGGRRYQIGRRSRERVAALHADGTIPLERFLSQDGSDIPVNDGPRQVVWYAQAWALIHFFTFGDGGRWRSSFPTFVRALASGVAAPEAFRQHVTPDLEDFDRRFKGYVANGVFEYLLFEPQSADGSTAATTTPTRLSAAETATIKALLTRDPARARKLVAAALADDPSNQQAIALNARQRLSMRDDTSLDALTSAVRTSSGDRYTCSWAMLALNVAGQFDRSLTICPANTPPHIAIAFERLVALEALGRASEAGPLRALISTAPESELDELQWRAWRYWEEGKYDAAARAADILAARGVGGPDTTTYMRIVSTAARCFAPPCDRARRDLQRLGIPPGARAWVTRVFEFFTEQIDAEEFLKQARSKAERTEAHAYIGLDLLARGRAPEARTHLQWVASEGTTEVSEYFVAVAHFNRLSNR